MTKGEAGRVRFVFNDSAEPVNFPPTEFRCNRSRGGEGDRPIFTDKRPFGVVSRRWKAFVFRRENASVPDP